MITRARTESGGVNAGLEEPKRAVVGRSSAAAMCMRPESLVTTCAANDIRSIASSSEVRPAKSTHTPPQSRWISAVMAASFCEPMSQTW